MNVSLIIRSTLVLAMLLTSQQTFAEAKSIQGNADTALVNGMSVEFTFKQNLPEPGELRFPRLNARLKSVYWKGNSEEQLTLSPEPLEWRVKLTQPPETGPKVVIVELLDAPEHHRNIKTIDVSRNAESTEIPAHFAVTHGKKKDSEKLRFEPQPHKNTVGYWTIATDWVDWSLNVKDAGEFHLDILQGCGTGQGGSEVSVLITHEGKKIDEVKFTVEETGHFQNFKLRRIGSVSIPTAGTYNLEIRPTKLAKNAVMDVRKVVLTPVK